MFVRIVLGALALAIISTPAFAESQCGVAPIAPTLTNSDQLLAMDRPAAEAKMTSMNADMKTYRAQVKDYSNCLSTAMDAAQRGISSSSDKEKVAKLQREYADDAKAFNSVQTESADINNNVWNKIAAAYCAKDPDFCKKS